MIKNYNYRQIVYQFVKVLGFKRNKKAIDITICFLNYLNVPKFRLIYSSNGNCARKINKMWKILLRF